MRKEEGGYGWDIWAGMVVVIVAFVGIYREYFDLLVRRGGRQRGIHLPGR